MKDRRYLRQERVSAIITIIQCYVLGMGYLLIQKETSEILAAFLKIQVGMIDKIASLLCMFSRNVTEVMQFSHECYEVAYNLNLLYY